MNWGFGQPSALSTLVSKVCRYASAGKSQHLHLAFLFSDVEDILVYLRLARSSVSWFTRHNSHSNDSNGGISR